MGEEITKKYILSLKALNTLRKMCNIRAEALSYPEGVPLGQ